MSLAMRLNNIYVIDTKMFDFDNYCAAYLVEGKELALIDTGLPTQIEAVRAGINAHGFSISDISYIFITHPHLDHCGNAAPFLRESPGANVYVHPAGLTDLIDPSIDLAKRKEVLPPAMAAGFGEMEPVPPSRIRYLNEGDVFDLGDGEKLRIISAPGHHPGGIVILEEKNQGLFINDLVGNYLPDADAHYPLNPPSSDPIQAIESIKKLIDLPVAYLYLGHYGICQRPKEVMERAINCMQQLLDIGRKCISEGKPEIIANKVFEMMLPELEKLRPVRGEVMYNYATHEHVSSQVQLFAKYCRERFN